LPDKFFAVLQIYRKAQRYITMTELPMGLHFYWYKPYEPKAGEEHPRCWGQLCASMHRLTFVREELSAITELPDVDLALERLAYHMENHLVGIYELRERAAKLIATYAGYRGDIGLLKARHKRHSTVAGLDVKQAAKELYLKLLFCLDDDIALRNRNTHDTFLSLGYFTGHDIYDRVSKNGHFLPIFLPKI
jgi:hypothetical protein